MDLDSAGRDSTLSGNPIRSGSEYVESLRGRNLEVYLMGELVAEPVDHPIMSPRWSSASRVIAVAATSVKPASATY